ncbi:hypothetical protein FKM82_021389 [Ascaphus truei]
MDSSDLRSRKKPHGETAVGAASYLHIPLTRVCSVQCDACVYLNYTSRLMLGRSTLAAGYYSVGLEHWGSVFTAHCALFGPPYLTYYMLAEFY